jgi:hypothetical protein
VGKSFLNFFLSPLEFFVPLCEREQRIKQWKEPLNSLALARLSLLFARRLFINLVKIIVMMMMMMMFVGRLCAECRLKDVCFDDQTRS